MSMFAFGLLGASRKKRHKFGVTMTPSPLLMSPQWGRHGDSEIKLLCNPRLMVMLQCGITKQRAEGCAAVNGKGCLELEVFIIEQEGE